MGNYYCTDKKELIKLFNKSCSARNRYTPIDLDNSINGFKLPLSEREIEALKDSWEKVRTKWVDICGIAFSRWFTTYPELRQIFKSFSQYPTLEEALASKELGFHAKKLQSVVDAVICKVDKRKELMEILLTVGRSHFSLGAQHTHCTALATCLQFGLCETFKDLDLLTESAWDSLFQFIMDILKYGIRLEEHELKPKSLTEKENTCKNLDESKESSSQT
ncbi:neuroglobin isoform X3 [Hydra vulgaris]